MKIKIKRVILIMPDQSRSIIRPQVIITDPEHYRNTLRELTGATKILFDMEETEEN